MNELKVSGKITSISDVEKGTSKAGKDWQKQNFVIDTGEKFNNIICFQVFGTDKCEALTKQNKVGDKVNVSFNQNKKNMEFIEEYKGFRILRDIETGFFKLGYLGADFSDINFLKKIIDIKNK